MTKHALAISTYFRYGINPERLNIFKKSIYSLLDSGYNGHIYICDDGSNTTEHMDIIDNLDCDNISIYRQPENRGYARIKNLGIKSILESDCEFGFLCDDDLLYTKGWWNYYIDAYEKTGFPHYSFYNHTYYDDGLGIGEIFFHNDVKLRLTPLLQGGMLTFSRSLIEKIGYYKVLPRKLGHEHTNFTLRVMYQGIIPGFLDLADSLEYLNHINESKAVTTVPDDYEEQCRENGKYFNINLDKYEPCII